MCREAMQAVLSRASSEPGFLKKMFLDPEKTFSQYDLTLGEKKALLSGCTSDIEACAAKNVGPFLKKEFEKAMLFSRDYTDYFTHNEGEVEEDISELLPELATAQTDA